MRRGGRLLVVVVMVSSEVLGHCPGRLLGLTWSLVTWHVVLYSTRVHVYSYTLSVASCSPLVAPVARPLTSH